MTIKCDTCCNKRICKYEERMEEIKALIEKQVDNIGNEFELELKCWRYEQIKTQHLI